MTNQIENESNNILEGELQCPNDRLHLFTNIDALCDFIKVFKIRNANIRYGQDANGRMVYQLVYRTEEN